MSFSLLSRVALCPLVLCALASAPAMAAVTSTWSVELDSDYPQAAETDYDGYYNSHGTYDSSEYVSFWNAHMLGDPGYFLISGTGSSSAITTMKLSLGGSATWIAANSVTTSPALYDVGVKYYTIAYQIGGDISDDDFTPVNSVTTDSGNSTKWVSIDSIPAGTTQIWVKITPVNDRVITGSKTVSLGLEGVNLTPPTSATMELADDDVRMVVKTPVPVVAEDGSDGIGAFRTQFSTLTRASSGGLSISENLEFKVKLDNISSVSTSGHLDATPGTSDPAEYLLVWMRCHASTSAYSSTGTADYGNENMFTQGALQSIGRWTKGWEMAADASSGDATVYVTTSGAVNGEFYPLDFFYSALGGDGIQIDAVNYGYLVTVTQTTDTTSTTYNTMTTSSSYTTNGVTVTPGYSGSAVSGSVTTTVSMSKIQMFQLSLASGIESDLSVNASVYNFGCWNQSNGTSDIVDVAAAGYYGVEIGYLPMAAFAASGSTLTQTVSGSQYVRMSVSDTADYVLDNPDNAIGIIKDDDSYMSISSVNNATVSSSLGTAGNIVLTWTSALPIDVPVTVAIDTTNSSAKEQPSDGSSGSYDFVYIPRTWTLSAGSTTLTIPVTPLIANLANWSSSEQSRTLRLRIKTSYDYSLDSSEGSNGTAVDVAITRSAGTVTVASKDSATTISESASAVSTGYFTITLARASSVTRGVAISYTMSGTATAGVDYTALSGTATIASGSSTVDIPIAVLPDSLAEGDETVVISLTESDGYLLGDTTTATLTITDSAPKVSIVADSSSVSEGDSMTFTCSYTGEQRSTFSVPFTVSGTATQDTDYTLAPSSSVTFSSSSKSATVTLTTVSDDTTESDETVILTLTASSSSAYTLSSSAYAATTKITDSSSSSTGDNQPNPSAGGGSTSSGCGLGSGVAGILLGMFLLLRLRLRSDKRSRAA